MSEIQVKQSSDIVLPVYHSFLSILFFHRAALWNAPRLQALPPRLGGTKAGPHPHDAPRRRPRRASQILDLHGRFFERRRAGSRSRSMLDLCLVQAGRGLGPIVGNLPVRTPGSICPSVGSLPPLLSTTTARSGQDNVLQPNRGHRCARRP
jgi:hypothetical protein